MSSGNSNTTSNQMWGGRFAAGPSAIMEEINASIGFDKKLYAQDIAGSIAHATMLAAKGIITAEDRDQIVAEHRPAQAEARVLLAGRDHERGAVGAGVGEVADGVPEAGGGVEVEERGAAGGLGVAVGHAHDGGLLEGEHVGEVVGLGEGVEQRQLGAAGVAEDVSDAFRAEHVEHHVAGEHHGGRP